MPVSAIEYTEYQKFTSGIAERLGSLQFDSEMTVWHYTNGAGLVGILQSGQIVASQVACLNVSMRSS